ncbi:MAG: 3-keto-disaccharide hydrolase [Acidobacteriota bacterium]
MNQIHIVIVILAGLLIICPLGAAEAEEGFVPLFNGENLDGWVLLSGRGQGYFVEDSKIVLPPGGGGNLLTEDVFADFVLRFEFKLEEGSNNGLAIRSPLKAGSLAYEGMELQIIDNEAERYKDIEPWQRHGSIYHVFPAETGHLKPAEEWNEQEVIVDGRQVTINLNGHTILDVSLDAVKDPEVLKEHPGLQRQLGHIGFLGHNEPVEFRNIRIKELGFVSLFNGNDLNGWNIPEGDNGHWKVLDGVIDYDAESEASGDKSLWSQKEYGDFVMRVEWRIKETPYNNPRVPIILPSGLHKRDANGEQITMVVPDSDSGILLRGQGKSQVNIWCWPVGSGEVYGYRMDRNMPPEVRAGVTPDTIADHDIGQWNSFEITMIGDRLKVVLNGTTVIEDAQLPGIPVRGPVGLQHHGAKRNGEWVSPPSLVQFRNISINEL